MFECRSKHINKSLGGKRSPDFSNRKNDKTMKKFLEIMMIVFCPYIVIGINEQMGTITKI